MIYLTLVKKAIIKKKKGRQAFTRMGLPRCLSGKESSCQCRRHRKDRGSVTGSGRAPGEGNGNPLQNSCLGNPMDRGAKQATVHRVTNSTTVNPRSGQSVLLSCLYIYKNVDKPNTFHTVSMSAKQWSTYGKLCGSSSKN